MPGWTMRIKWILRTAFLSAGAISAATFLALLCTGTIAPPSGPPTTAFRTIYRGAMTLDDDEPMCLMHNPPHRYKGKPSTFDDYYQILRRTSVTRPSPDDMFTMEAGTLLSSI